MAGELKCHGMQKSYDPSVRLLWRIILRAHGTGAELPMNAMVRVILSAIVMLYMYGGAVSAGKLVLNSGVAQVTLLELYTSQGCSSCPPAERWLNDYVDSADLWSKIVPLAFHVDYWDHIGWKDSLADSTHGERQRSYARAGRTRTVYTPGMFVNGREWRGWTFHLNPRTSNRQPGILAVSISDRVLSATFQGSVRPLELHIALLGFGIDTKIERGENRNKILRQEFVVLVHEVHNATDGRWDVPMPVAKPAERHAVAVWVSEPDKPAPLQATGGWLE